jgi:hypothetical protein
MDDGRADTIVLRDADEHDRKRAANSASCARRRHVRGVRRETSLHQILIVLIAVGICLLFVSHHREYNLL